MSSYHPRGYTLVEITIVMTIIGTLTTIALPAFNSVYERQQTRSALHALSTQFAVARSSAITLGTNISVCPSVGDGRCTEQFDWSSGWMMYRDPHKLGQPDTNEAILRQETSPTRAPMKLLSSTGRRFIRFLPDGRSAGTNLRVRVCSSDRLLGEVVVNNLGRVRSARTSDAKTC